MCRHLLALLLDTMTGSRKSSTESRSSEPKGEPRLRLHNLSTTPVRPILSAYRNPRGPPTGISGMLKAMPSRMQAAGESTAPLSPYPYQLPDLRSAQILPRLSEGLLWSQGAWRLCHCPKKLHKVRSQKHLAD